MRKIALTATFALLILAVSGPSSRVSADANDLVNVLMQKLAVSKGQAKGGAGAIFNTVKGGVSTSEFSKVEKAVPGIPNLMKAAPKSSGMGSLLGGIGGGNSSMKLADSFTKLGLSPDQAGKFTTVVLDYVESKGGSALRSVIQQALL
ncbi:MAG: hypothetical protein GTO40_19135 [Deltaproteobacteria bacterium]|nr:hypothetical protein [Deltaproteobacteria bacterium]